MRTGGARTPSPGNSGGRPTVVLSQWVSDAAPDGDWGPAPTQVPHTRPVGSSVCGNSSFLGPLGQWPLLSVPLLPRDSPWRVTLPAL